MQNQAPATDLAQHTWTEHYTDDGRKYYFNEQTGESEWAHDDSEMANEDAEIHAHLVAPDQKRSLETQVPYMGRDGQWDESRDDSAVTSGDTSLDRTTTHEGLSGDASATESNSSGDKAEFTSEEDFRALLASRRKSWAYEGGSMPEKKEDAGTRESESEEEIHMSEEVTASPEGEGHRRTWWWSLIRFCFGWDDKKSDERLSEPDNGRLPEPEVEKFGSNTVGSNDDVRLLHADLNAMKAQLEQAEQERQAMHVALQEAEKKRKVADQDVSSALDKLEEAKESAERAASDAAKMRDDTDAVEMEIAEARREAAQQVDEIHALQVALSRAKETTSEAIAAGKEREVELESALEREHAALEEARRQAESIQTMKEKELASVNAHMQNLEDDLGTATLKIGEQKREIEEAKANAASEAKAAAAGKEVEMSLHQQLTNLRDISEQAHERARIAEAESASRTAEAESARAAFEDASTRLALLTEEGNDMTARIASLTAEVQKVKMEGNDANSHLAAELERAREEALAARSSYSLDMNAAQKQVAVARSEKESVDREKALAAAEVVSLTESLHAEREKRDEERNAFNEQRLLVSKLHEQVEYTVARGARNAVHILRGVLQLGAATLKRYDGAWINPSHRSKAATGAFDALVPLAADATKQAGSSHLVSRICQHIDEIVAEWSRLECIVTAPKAEWRMSASSARTAVQLCDAHKHLADRIADFLSRACVDADCQIESLEEDEVAVLNNVSQLIRELEREIPAEALRSVGWEPPASVE